MKYRTQLRGFDLAEIESILRYGTERYLDTSTGRKVAVGKHREKLVMIPFEQDGESLTPVTVHKTSRQQINFRISDGRFIHE
jgi:hypothetical protein